MAESNPHISKLPLSTRVQRYQLICTNYDEDESVSGPLTRVGYSPDRMQEIKTLIATVVELINQRELRMADQKRATEVFQAGRDDADKLFELHMDQALLALHDDTTSQTLLAIDNGKETNIDPWFTQRRRFYTQLLASPELQARVLKAGLTEDDLKAGLALVEHADTLRSKQARARGQVQRTTKERDAAAADMDAWMKLFRDAARIAFKNDKQQLEKLGIIARS